jgi:hypothetical protein
VYSFDIKSLLCVQANRLAIHKALNDLFLKNPATDPTLSKVLKEMGFAGDKPVLQPEYPAIVGCGEPGEFILCPADTDSVSSFSDSAVETNAQFTNMLSKQYFRAHSIN